MSNKTNLKPEVLINVKNGTVVFVATSKDSLTYRLIDEDVKEIKDYEADETNIDIDKITNEISKEFHK
jgi:hypothetical protein